MAKNSFSIQLCDFCNKIIYTSNEYIRLKLHASNITKLKFPFYIRLVKSKK